MRTLKKVLALTVVLATVFSLTAFAAFTDADQINESCQDDINLMNALNVMVGDAEGTFRPNGTISRAEAAKMVYVVRNGGVDDKASGWTGMKVFNDVPAGAWYEGYVNYCASLGIIAGVGGNKFNPDGAVTGVELAKMMLVVAGYKPDVQGYTGANWSLNVINDAQQANMFEGYAIAFSASAPRQWAAKLFSNAILKTQMALYLGGELVNGAAFMADAATVGEKYFSLEIATGMLGKIPHVDFSGSTAVLDVNNNTSAIVAIPSDSTTEAGEFVFNASASLLGQEVNVVYKETSTPANGLDVKDTVYSVYATETSKVYDTTMDAITLGLNADKDKVTIKFAGFNGGKAKVLGEDPLAVITNLYNIGALAVTDIDESGDEPVVNADQAKLLSAKSTAPVRLVDTDGDGNLDVAFVTAPIYGTVRSYNAERFDFSTDAKFNDVKITSNRKEDDFKSFTFASTIAAKDVIRIDVDVTSGEVLYTVTKLEPTVASLTHVYEKDGKIKVGGTDYSFFGGEFDGTAVALTAAGYKDMLGKELTLYADGSYIFSATEGVSTTLGTNFAFVQGVNKNVPSSNGMSTVTKVQLVFADGTTGIYDYLDNSDTAKYFTAAQVGNKTGDDYDFVGKIVEYTISSSNVTFYKTPSVTANSDNGIKYKADSTGEVAYKSSNGTFGSVKVADGTVLFVPSDEYSNAEKNLLKKVTVVKGSELKGAPKINPAVTDTAKGMDYISAKQNGIDTLAYGILTDSDMSVAGTYAYTTANSFKVIEDGKTTFRVNAVLSGADDAEPVELTVTNDTPVLANKLYAVTDNGDGTYTLDKILASGFGEKKQMLQAVAGVSGNAVQADDLYFTTSSTKVFVVDMATGDITLGEVADITKADKPEEGEAYTNVFAEFNNDTDKNLTTVYVELYGNSVEKLIDYGADEGEEETSMAFTPAGTLPSGLSNVAMADAGEFSGDVKMKFETVTAANSTKAFTDGALKGATFGYDIEGTVGNFTIKLVAVDGSDAAVWDNTKKELTVSLSKDGGTSGSYTAAQIQSAIQALTASETGAPNCAKITVTGTLNADLDASAGNNAALGTVALEGGKDAGKKVTVTKPATGATTTTAVQNFTDAQWTGNVSISAGGVTATFNTTSGTWDGTEETVGTIAAAE